MNKKYDCLAMFSGGLDSLLAMKTMENLGIKVLGVHFTTPFFGAPELISKWEKDFNIKLISKDISEDYLKLITNEPKNGYGKNLNPCKDCKILMLKKIKELMTEYDAGFIISGEVVGQRPMSQNMNSLNLIEKEAEVQDILLRPLSAKNLPETKPEKEGLVNKEEMYDIKGRGRGEQLKLAEEFEIKKENIPSPAGGCLLTEKENVKRYKFVLENIKKPQPNDFRKANVGRHFFKNNYWLIVGRDKEENGRLERLKETNDIFIKTVAPAGPSSVLTNFKNEKIDESIIKETAKITAYFSTKARERGEASVEIENEEIKIEPREYKKLGWENVN